MKEPPSWLDCTLADVVHIVTSQQVRPSEIPENAWVLELEDVERDTSRVLRVRTARDRLVKSSKNAFKRGDVLFSRLRPNLNKVVLAEGSGFCTTEMVPLRPKRGLDSRFLFWWLQHPYFRQYAVESSHGLNMPRLGTKALQRAPFKLAPTEEQQQTVSTLEPICMKLWSLKQQLRSVPPQTELLRAAILSAAVKGAVSAEWRIEDQEHDLTLGRVARTSTRRGAQVVELHDKASRATSRVPELQEIAPGAANSVAMNIQLPDGWKWVLVSELVEPDAEIVYGIVQPGPHIDGGVPYVRGLDIVDGVIQLEQLRKTSPEIAAKYGRSRLRAGDVLLGIIRATKVAIVPPELDGANITQGTARFRPSKMTSSEFLAITLQSPPIQNWLHTHYRGIDMPGLNLADVRKLPLPVPPLREQEEIVDRVTLLLAHVAELHTRNAEAIESAEGCFRSALRVAFSGGFVSSTSKISSAQSLLREMARDSEPESMLGRRPSKTSKVKQGAVRELIVKVIQELPSSIFSLADIQAAVQMDYQSIREQIFLLLNERPPLIAQRFNAQLQTIEFVRADR